MLDVFMFYRANIKYAINEHIKTIDRSKKDFNCEACFRKFNQDYNLQFHFGLVHNGIIFQCRTFILESYPDINKINQVKTI